MKKKAAIIFLLLSFAFFTASASADLGNYNSYSSSSHSLGSSYGGGYGGYSGSYRGIYHTGGYSSYGFNVPSAIFIVIIIAGVYCIISRRRKYTPVNHTEITPDVKDNTDEITTAIIQYDPDFSSSKFISWVKEAFITLQTAWSERDFDKVRNFEKEELFNQHKKQLEEYIRKGWINDLSRININQAYLYKYVRDKDYEYLTVFIDSRMGDYIKDEKTGSIIKGDPSVDYYLKYLYTFMRKTGVLTDAVKSNKSVTNCPNCGAPTTVTSSGQCEYCGSVITTGEFDWVLSDITGVNERTNIDNGGIEIKAK